MSETIGMYDGPSEPRMSLMGLKVKPPTRRDVLNQKIAYLEVELAGCKAALEALDQSPDIEKVIELLDRFGR